MDEDFSPPDYGLLSMVVDMGMTGCRKTSLPPSRPTDIRARTKNGSDSRLM